MFRYKQELIFNENRRLKKQIPMASAIYDAICEKKSLSEIKDLVRVPLSQEIRSILDKLESIGYISSQIKPLKKAPSISVVIPHYKHEKELNEALFALKEQSVAPDEVIVVDNNSPNIETVKKIVKSYGKNLKIRLIALPKNLYVGKSRQTGVEAATSDIVMLHDADDISHKKRIELTKKVFELNPTTLHVTTGLARFQGNFLHYLANFEQVKLENHIIHTKDILQTMRQKFINQKFSSHKTVGSRIGCYEASSTYFFGCQAAHTSYRREVVKIIKWADPNDFTFTKFEDYDFNFILLLAGQRSYHIDLPLVYYRVGNSSYEQCK